MASGTTSKLDFVLRLVDQVTKPLGRVNQSFSQLGQQGANGIKQMGVGLGGLVGTGYALQQSLQPALAQNAALGTVKSLGVAGDALDLLNTKSLRFSIAYGENATAFVSSAYDIQSAIAGLTGTQLAAFTGASNVLAKATKADAATITNYVGTMYGIFKGQADSMGKAEWVENLAGTTALAVQMFKTTGAQMSAAFTGIGANATAAGVGLSEQMAILGTLQSTMSGGEAGTKYKAFLSGVGNAQDKLGLKFTDSQGRLLPMLNILDKLKLKFGDTLTVADSDVLKKAFGSDEAVGLIKLLMNDTAGLANSMDQLGKVKGMAQAETMAKAMVDPWQRFNSAVEAVRIAFGQKLLPTLNPLIERLAEGGSSLVRWTTLFPNLTRVIGLTVLGVVVLTAAVSLMTFVFGVWRTAAVPVLMLWKLMTAASLGNTRAYMVNAAAMTLSWMRMAVLVIWLRSATASMMIWQAAIWLTNTALWANPVTWIVVGIIALVAVIIAAVYYWDEWTGALLNSDAFIWVSDQLTALSSWFDSMGGWSGMATAAWDGIVAIFHSSINELIAMLNKIPGVDIKAKFGEMPAGPDLSSLEAAKRAQQTISAAIPSLSPSRASAVPPGGLLTSIQNSTTQNNGKQVETVNIYTNKPMTTHELQGLMDMAG
ncbi:phage tail tape measure protein [Pseudomonas huanghezhanensis]|uniref:phage tail tape measure protein n=1 Tax=Pseudomonas huanghezhanensis TaxID=3002903 RepID=UPI002285CF5A|nr:phage tail tape measure protein [Pseudomonas sp. BSw22131]